METLAKAKGRWHMDSVMVSSSNSLGLRDKHLWVSEWDTSFEKSVWCCWRVVGILALKHINLHFFYYFWASFEFFLGLLHCLWLALNLGALVCTMKTGYTSQTQYSPLGVWSPPRHLGTASFLSQSNHIWLKLYFSVVAHGMLFGTSNLFVSSAP